jgi:hypothetical protein
MLRRAILACLVTLALLVPRAALAQMIAQPMGVLYPDRILPDGTDMGYGPRPMNLTPLGISYSDCLQDQTLQFQLSVTGFTGQDIQIWASRNGDCTQDTQRGIGAVSSCWPVGPSSWHQAVNQVTSFTYTFKVRVQDIVGRQNDAFTQSGVPGYVSQGPAACATQQSFAGTSFGVFFLPIANGVSAGTAYKYNVNVDMLGPPAPAGVTDQAGDTLLVMNWTPNSDTNTLGYDIFIDPIPGHEDAGPSMADGAAVNTPDAMLVCPDTGGAPPPDATDDGGGDGSLDGTTDSSSASDSSSSSDSGCHYVNQGGGGSSGGQGTCTSSVLSGSSSIIVDAGAITVVDESGTSEGGTTTESGTGGIANIPPAYLIGGSGTGITITDKSTGTYTISGLTDNVTYNVVVSAVDAFGNVGPPSGEICDYPAPVVDFWQQYRQDGGGAGGFCALDNVGAPVGPSIVGMGVGAAALALARRRRRRGK